MTSVADIAIIGAGMAGASLAAEVSGSASVLLLEAEDRPGYHSTGRSAAFWSETYGGRLVQPLTSASRPFLEANGLLGPRGAVHIADAESAPRLAKLVADFPQDLFPVGRRELEALVPGIAPRWEYGLREPTCSDIDVAALHELYLRRARRNGVRLATGARVVRVERGRGAWLVETTAGAFEAALLVDAAGAWADEVAALAGVTPLGIQPYRRTLAQLRVAPPAPPDLPLVIDAAERFYFKPEAGGRLWLSPHDETPCEPCDCAPEEIDVAIALDRLERVVDWRVERVERSWAGLRSFAPDRLPVYGFAADAPDFFWFAAQGGFGIQTAPAAAKLGAALLLGTSPPSEVSKIDASVYSPGRFAA